MKFQVIIFCLIIISGCKTTSEIHQLEENEVASVFGKKITLEDFEQEVERLTKTMLLKNYELSDEEDRTFRTHILNSMIQQKMFSIKMDALNIEPDKNYVDEQLALFRSQFETEDQMLLEIEAQGYTLERLKKEYTYQSRLSNLSIYIEDSDISISEEEMQEYYNSNMDDMFSKQGTITARHILIPSDEENSLEEINRIREEIVNGLDFAKAAEMYSKGPSAQNGGLLPPFTKGQMVKEFEDAALSTPVNEVSPPVLTQFGYHLIYVEEREDKLIVPFEETRSYITVKLKQEKFFNNLKKEANILKAEWALE